MKQLKYLILSLLTACSVEVGNPVASKVHNDLDEAIENLKEANLTLDCLNKMMSLSKEDIVSGATHMWHKSASALSEYEVKAYLHEWTRRCKEKNRE